jgi:surface carbohydrate biosynthesis protein
MSRKINLLFPIEIINREIDFRLMLAGVCARPEYRIWVGSMAAMYKLVQSNQGGLYVGKHILQGRFPNASQERYRVLKQNKFHYIHLDEEGAVHHGGPEQWKHIFAYTLDPRFLAAEDKVCTWGDWQRDFYRGYEPTPACAENIQTTGHPRFDLYKPEYRDYFAGDAHALKERFGDYVLMNTNFSFVNKPRGLDNAFSARFGYDPADPEKRYTQVKRWAHLSQILSCFVKLAMRLSREFPQLNVVIRPHPSEDITFYNMIFAEVPNVHIMHEGSVGPWILGSRCLIHDGCTTALEAHFAGTPILNYKPFVDEANDKFLPNLFGRKCFDEESAVAYMQEVLADKVATDSQPPADQTALSLLSNFQHDSWTALADVIHASAQNVAPGELSVSQATKTSLSRRVKNKLGLGSRAGKIRNGKLPEFYGFNPERVDERLKLVSALLDKPLQHRFYSSELLTVETA